MKGWPQDKSARQATMCTFPPELRLRSAPSPITETAPRNSHRVSKRSLGSSLGTPRRFRPSQGSRGCRGREGSGRVREVRGGRGKDRGGSGTSGRPPFPHTAPSAPPARPPERADLRPDQAPGPSVSAHSSHPGCGEDP